MSKANKSRFTCLVVMSVGVVCALHHDDASGEKSSMSAYADRALDLPELGAEGQCPVSIGDVNVVSSDHRYIFGAGAHFYGAGPVYLGLSWKPSDRVEAVFDLDRAPRVHDGHRLKTPWIMSPSYHGEALVRGARIGTETSPPALFLEMILRSDVPGTIPSIAGQAVDAVWGFWPSSMVLPGPGCYAIQIDTEMGSDRVVFEARLSK